MCIGWITFDIQYNAETECNVAYIVGGEYDDSKLSRVVNELENNFEISVIL